MYGLLKKFGTWGELHEESELLALEAERLRGIDSNQSIVLYAQAAVKEEEVLDHIPREGSTQQFYEAVVVSAAALYFKGGDYAGSQRIIGNHSPNLRLPYFKKGLEEVVEALMKMN